jgi:Flp pilus assembly protein TadD
VYLNALHNPFVYDDYHTVAANPSIVTLTNLRAIVSHDMTRPLVNASYAVDRALWGAGPFGFHLTSLLLHLLNVVLLFQIARRLDSRVEVAFAAAALFAVHPMMTESVGYVSGRAEVLCATWFFSAILCGRRWLGGEGTRWAIFTVGFWAAGLATKETAAMFPLTLLAYDWTTTPDAFSEKRHRFLFVHLPLLAVAVFAGLIRVAVLRIEYGGAASIHWSYALIALDVARRYVTLILNPAGQAMFHEVAPVGSIFAPRALIALAALLLAGAFAWSMRRRAGLVSFGIIWFLLLLVPSSVLIVLDQGEPMAEHRVYLASAGLFLAAGAGIGQLRAWSERVGGRARFLVPTILVLVLTSFAIDTVIRNTIWASPVALWREAVDLAPGHFRPRLLLGEALQDAGRRDEAVAEYRTAIELRPADETGYVKLGQCLIDMGRWNEATDAFARLQALNPQSVPAAMGLGTVAVLSNHPETARQHFLNIIDQDPRSVPARQALAALDEGSLDNPAESLRLCEEIQRVAPGTPGSEDCIRRSRGRLSNASK